MTPCNNAIYDLVNINICYSNPSNNLINVCTSSNMHLFSPTHNSVLSYINTAVVTLDRITLPFTSSILIVAYQGQLKKKVISVLNLKTT